MALELKPLKEMLALGKEKLNELLAPARATLVKAKFDVEIAELSTKIMEKQSGIQEMLASFGDEKKIDFVKLDDNLDEIEIMEGRLARYNVIVSQLFPTVAA